MTKYAASSLATGRTCCRSFRRKRNETVSSNGDHRYRRWPQRGRSVGKALGQTDGRSHEESASGRADNKRRYSSVVGRLLDSAVPHPRNSSSTLLREIKAKGFGAAAIAKELGIGRASVYRVCTDEMAVRRCLVS